MPTVDEMVKSAKRSRMSSTKAREARQRREAGKPRPSVVPKYDELNNAPPGVLSMALKPRERKKT